MLNDPFPFWIWSQWFFLVMIFEFHVYYYFFNFLIGLLFIHLFDLLLLYFCSILYLSVNISIPYFYCFPLMQCRQWVMAPFKGTDIEKILWYRSFLTYIDKSCFWPCRVKTRPLLHVILYVLKVDLKTQIVVASALF